MEKKAVSDTVKVEQELSLRMDQW